jgi:hypothetical protein
MIAMSALILSHTDGAFGPVLSRPSISQHRLVLGLFYTSFPVKAHQRGVRVLPIEEIGRAGFPGKPAERETYIRHLLRRKM